MNKADILVSAVAILRDNAGILPAFIGDLSATLERQYVNHEVILIDNGSVDGTEDVIRKLLSQYQFVRYLRLTRPADDETAVMAGLDASIGDYVAMLHPDFDAPSEIAPMVETCRDGVDLVVGVDRNGPPPGTAYRALRSVFSVLARRLIQLELITETTGLRVLSRQAVNALVKVRMRRRYFAIVATDVGLRTSVHPYDRISRSGLQPTRRLFRAIRIGSSALVHNSVGALRVATGLGLVGGLLSFLYSLYVVGIYLFKTDVMPGWTTLSLAMSGLFALAFLILALMGEFLGRLLEEATDRPLYHVRDEQSSAVMLGNRGRLNVLGRSDEPSSSSSAEGT